MSDDEAGDDGYNEDHNNELAQDDQGIGGTHGTDSFQVPLDSFGDVMMSLVMAHDVQLGHIRDVHVRLWIAAAVLMYVGNLTLQCLLSFAIFGTSIEQKADSYEGGQAKRMREEVMTAIRENRAMEQNNTTLQFCESSDVEFLPVYALVLSVWFLRMLDEIARITWFVLVLHRVALFASSDVRSEDEDSSEGSLPREDKLICEFDVAGVKHYQIQHLTTRLRCCSWVLAVPRFAMTVWIMWVGAEFLVYTGRTHKLILKTLVCTFFVTCEHVIFHALLSEAKKRRIERTTFLFHRLKSEDWSNYGSTVVRLAVVIAMLAVTWFVVFGDIRSFRYACLEYWRSFPRIQHKHLLFWWF